MIFFEQTGVGQTANSERPVYDSTGTGMLPLQTAVTGTASYRINGRVDLQAPWMEVIEASSQAALTSFAWVPYLQLEVLSGSGTVRVWIGEK